MLYLVRAEVRQTPSVTQGEFMELAVKEWEYLSGLPEGKVVAAWAMAGRRGGVVILDVESADELEDIIYQLPLYPFLDEMEIIPLRDPKARLKLLRKASRALRILRRRKSTEKKPSMDRGSINEKT